jgi:UDP-N-acetylmuramoyl-tripeptide--D-alanyl-D-alanine ligase
MMDTATAAHVMKGRLLGASARFNRVSTDTRTIAPGDLYVALQGERYDGHDFVADALTRGAVAAVISNAKAATLEGRLIAVSDPLAALGQLAAHWRRQFAIPVIVVVGSNGKTTVKEMLASVLRAHFGDDAVLATRGNLNNAIGLPLTLLGLREAHRVAAIELGMNHAGETRELAAIAQPTVALVNNAQREHQEFMRSIADVAQEHAALVRALRAGGAAVLNGDDAHIQVWRDAAPAGTRTVEFALDHPSAVRGVFTTVGGGGVLALHTSQGDATLHLAVAGRHNASNALAAAAAALAVGVPLDAIVRGLETFRPVAGRLVAHEAPNGVHVIDDSYNANPDSVRAAIDVLAQAPGAKWLVLGDMGEVGDAGPAFHREVGDYARASGIDRLYTAGTLTLDSVQAFGAGAHHCESVEALASRLAADIVPATTVLVKGSRFMRMERVVERLLGNAVGGAH